MKMNSRSYPANPFIEVNSKKFLSLKMNIYDVIIIGGGPAGLNAAVVLGRCRRNVLLFDTGQQRNRLSHGVHNYLTRDDILPVDFLNTAYSEIKKYGVAIIHDEIIQAEKTKKGIFAVRGSQQKINYAKKLLIATGLKDNIPNIPGIETLYGQSVFHCPYCDAWEVKDKLIGIYAKRINGMALSLSLKTWSSRVTLYCDGRNYLKEQEKKILQRLGIPFVVQKIKSLEGKNGRLKNIILTNGEMKKCDALFFTHGSVQQSSILKNIGCMTNKKGIAVTNRKQQTNIAGLYVAGDVSKDMHFVVVAAAEGAKAGVSINQELQQEEIF
jgi:thioredoxin reductase